MCLPIHKWTFHMDMFSLTHICKHTTCTHLPVCLYTHMWHVCPYRLCDRHTVISNTMDWCEKHKKYFRSDVNTTCCGSLALACPPITCVRPNQQCSSVSWCHVWEMGGLPQDCCTTEQNWPQDRCEAETASGPPWSSRCHAFLCAIVSLSATAPGAFSCIIWDLTVRWFALDYKRFLTACTWKGFLMQVYEKPAWWWWK